MLSLLLTIMLSMMHLRVRCIVSRCVTWAYAVTLATVVLKVLHFGDKTALLGREMRLLMGRRMYDMSRHEMRHSSRARGWVVRRGYGQLGHNADESRDACSR